VKLLVVEDDAKIATAVRRGLEAEGFSIEGAFDLIVLDILLPGRNGYQICAVRATGPRS